VRASAHASLVLQFKDGLTKSTSAPLHADIDPRVIATRSVFARTKPTFQHFFTDFYAHPQAWLARRNAYTRSVAASSMVAYIAGIGDRHTSNQLIDVDSGEVVMIDFGMAFEQAKLLPTPEQARRV
jgi:serine-protein kinase ATM